ncbi:FtsX-like permease family protein [Candidatus Viridilinea mediisalina]|uniref:Permease n=1 Tax=Candidatus Viridilinea mediisalina TaxID=2024553 RepID=A0A2A6RNR1_9CHLR|nr:FtsX-like permease family protein [Candidatus Viridilinea mediisalina]PDW04518.1 permease [Candidatus Viridilinea mediisalina]
MLFRTTWRFMLRHPWQLGLCVLGVALGVAMVVAIDLANASARRAFQLSAESVVGRATHQVLGGPTGLSEELYRQLRVEVGLRSSAPVVEGYVQVPALENQTLQLLGVDPLAEPPFRAYMGERGGELDLAALMAEPATVLLAETTARRAGLELGDALTLQIGTHEVDVRLVGLLQPNDQVGREALEGLLISDIATAQELLGMVGRLSRIDLILPATSDPPPQLLALLPPGAELLPAATRSNALEQMTRAFELNLTALSFLALIVGMFLIYNTVTFSVVQRRMLFGTLRCLGVTRGQLAALVLTEAALISLVGSLLGLALGVILGRGLVGLVTQTINDLYFVVTVRSLALDPLVLLRGFVLGVVATLVAAAVPTLEALLTPPRTVLRRSSVEDRARHLVPRLAGVGLLLLLLGLGLLGLPAEVGVGSLFVAFTALFAIVIGAALLAPLFTVGLMRIARPLLGAVFGLLGRMAARAVEANLSRTAVAIAALMVAVSVTIGVGIMVHSFRQTVVVWLEHSLMADVYISPPSNTANRIDGVLDPALPAQLAELEGVAAVVRLRSTQVNTLVGPTILMAVDAGAERGRTTLRFVAGGDDATWAAWDAGALLISEPFALRSGLGVGDSLRLRTDRGLQDFPIAGVYYDYSSDRGIIRLRYNTYRAAWDDPEISSLALYATPGSDSEALLARLRAATSGTGVLVSSNRALRESSLAVFDRTFAITAVLQLLATIVAFIGILSALMALQLERGRELAMLRANGLTPRQVWGLILGQTGLIGAVAGLLAIPLGLAMALVLVYVINRRSFGWTLDLALEPRIFLQALLVALIAAFLAGLYPAYQMSRTSPAAALREE